MALQIDPRHLEQEHDFAGDFHSYPPGVNPPLYSHTVSTVLHNTHTSYSAEMD